MIDSQENCKAIHELLRSAGSKFARAANQQFAGQNLTGPQTGILLLLDKNGAMKMSDISASLGMIGSNVTNICKRLENMRLVRRVRQGDDQRVVKVELTAEAEGKMDGIKASVNGFYRRMRERVSGDDLKDIYTGLLKLNKLFDLFLDMGS